MKPNVICFFLALMLAAPLGLVAQDDFRKQAPKPGPAPVIEMGEYETFTLDNGLQVIVVEDHKLPRISWQVFVDIPPMLEGEKTGLASMAGDLMSTGTTKRSKAELDEAIDFMGASLSTSSRGIFASSLTKHSDQLLEIIREVLFMPSYPQEEFDKLKKQTLTGLQQVKEDPNAISSNVSQVLRFGADHPYGEVTTEKTVEQITLEDCKAYYENFFKPNISYLVIVGDISVEKARQVAVDYFGEWEPGEVETPTFDDPQKPEGTEVDFVNKTGAVQSVITLTYPVDYTPGNPDAVPARVMNTVFGGYFSSRLNANIREDKGYSYGVRSGLSADPLVGYFTAGGSVRNEVTDSALVEFIAEMNRMREEEITEEELQTVKNVIYGTFARGLERPQTIASYALNTIRYELPVDYYPTYLQKLEKVTTADVKAMARKYLTPGSAHILVVGNQDEVAERLTQFASSGEIVYYDAFGKKIDKATEALPEGLTADQVIEDYINALGGREKLEEVENLSMSMSTSLQGMTLNMNMQQQKPDMMHMTVIANGMTLSETAYDGEKGYQMQNGKKQIVEGEDAQSLAEQAIMFSELNYRDLGYTAALKGVEDVDGTRAYKVVMTDKDGKTKTTYFDTKTSLKIREVEPNADTGQTITNDYSDYKEVEGIMFPHTLTTIGAMPMPLKLALEKVEVNTDLDPAIFEVKE